MPSHHLPVMLERLSLIILMDVLRPSHHLPVMSELSCLIRFLGWLISVFATGGPQHTGRAPCL